jgi:methylase of polypeptide subunit release factors
MNCFHFCFNFAFNFNLRRDTMAAAGSVLDFCSGSGTLAAAVRLRAPAANITLLDADAVALAAARDNLGGGALYPKP